MSDHHPHLRRFDDYIKTAGLIVLTLCGPAVLWLLLKLYGNLPEEQRATREAVSAVQIHLANITQQLDELKVGQRVAEDWRQRQVKLEAVQDRHTAEILDLRQRVTKVEERPVSIFGGGGKK